jgi:O-antigen/teichoic acid export membrane protein
MVAMKWIARLMGLVNTAILARILVPADFGIVAMCTLVVGVLEILCELNVAAVLIQRPDATNAHWNSAFTLRLAQGIAVGLLIIVARPVAVGYFKDDRVADILPWLALSVLFQSIENIGLIAYRKDLDFRKDFLFTLSRKAVGIVLTIVAAVILRSYWALVIGIVLGSAMSTALSYVVHPYRPRLSFAMVGELWVVSKWFLLNGISYYLLEKTDELVVGGRTGPRALGTYTVASEIAELPTSEIVLPMMRALFPGFAKLQGDPVRLKESYLNVLGVTATFACSVGFGTGLLAPYLVPIILGPKWLDAIPLLSVLAIGGALRMIYHNTGALLLAIGRIRAVALTAAAQAILVPPVLWTALRGGDVLAMTYVKVALTGVFLAVWFATLRRILGIPLRDLGARIYRPLVAGATMYAAVLVLRPLLPQGALAGLVTTIVVGAALFTGCLFGAWHLARRPRGAESFIIEVAATRVWAPLRRRFGRGS